MAPLGSLEGPYVFRNMHEEQNRLIQQELRLVKNNNASTRARKVAPGAKNNLHPRIRRRLNKYGSKPKLTPGYIAITTVVWYPIPNSRWSEVDTIPSDSASTCRNWR